MAKHLRRDDHNWPLPCYMLYARLGLDPNKHLPTEGMAPKDIDGTMVYVLPADTPKPVTRRFVHRVIAICECGAHIPAGRLHQHMTPKGKPFQGKCRWKV